MNVEQRSGGKLAGVVLAGIFAVSVGGAAAGVRQSRPDTSERSMAVWAERLSDQAEAYRRERFESAYSARLRMMAQGRVDAAYAERLDGIAAALGRVGMSDRAERAWADRLNGLADQ